MAMKLLEKTETGMAEAYSNYIRNSINYIIRDDLFDENLETITIEISKPKSKPFLINCSYRPPDTPLELFNNYEDLITKMDSESKEVILIGDFNCHWSRLINNKANARQTSLLNLQELFT
jgi:endonuclease/exonuclease/phosphatase family metal-dependent hydrolase